MKILFVRHGQTDLNNPRRMQGISDLELNEIGISQAEVVRNILEKYNIDFIIVSPLKRAVQTAQIINTNMHKKIIIDKRITEMDYGLLEGKTYLPDYWDMDYDYKSINGENISDFQKRIYNFIDEIKVKYPEKTILIVAHRRCIKNFQMLF